MSLEKFTFAALAKLDGGRVAKSVDQAILRAVADCNDRPGLDKARRVTLEIDIEPVMEGSLHDIALTFRVGEKAPPRGSAAVVMRPAADGTLMFQDLSLEDPDQETIPFVPATAVASGGKK
jgi:hypothetical protein